MQASNRTLKTAIGNVAIIFIGFYILLTYQEKQMKLVIEDKIYSGIADVRIQNKLYLASCYSQHRQNMSILPNSSINICDPGYACQSNLSHSLPFTLDMTEHSMAQIETAHASVRMGGEWAPCDCVSASRLAIIIPFRDRHEHLLILLNNLIPFLQRQNAAFRIFLIEQDGEGLFNRAAVSNAGFLEVLKLDAEFDCFIFHDVDLLPTDLCNVYTCRGQPRHLAVAMSKYKYKMPYPTYCGGALALSEATMRKMNGFTNVMYGWGGEDDDIYARLKRNKLNVTRYPSGIGRYIMIKHKRDELNPHSGRSMRDSVSHWKYSKYDGLSTARYDVKYVQHHPLYTQIMVHFEGAPRNRTQAVRYFRGKVRELRKTLTGDKNERKVVYDIVRSQRREKLRAEKNKIKKKLHDVKKLSKVYKKLTGISNKNESWNVFDKM